MDSAGLRKQILKKRDSLSGSQRSNLSTIITNRLRRFPPFISSNNPLFYISFKSEVETHGLIKERLAAGKTVLVPKTDTANRRLVIYRIRDWAQDLQPGAYGILEPSGTAVEQVDPSMVDLVLVPGSVFDRQGGRYGYGGGYYDRFLAKKAPGALRIGLAFDLQVLPHIDLEAHDQRVDVIITEKETLILPPHYYGRPDTL